MRVLRRLGPFAEAAAAVLLLTVAGGCHQQQLEPVNDVFSADSPVTYVAKVKDILVGLPPTDAELAQVTQDPSSLGALVDQWMQLPQYQQKMMVFFQLAFQQTQLTLADFTDNIPPLGLGTGPQLPLLLQNLKESFARTVLALNAEGRPLTDAFTTHRLMMTPALMELYAFLDVRRLDNNAKIIDQVALASPTLQITLESAAGPVDLAQSIDPQSPNYMHWYNPTVGKLAGYPDPSCNVDPIVVPVDSYFIHELLYGGVGPHKTPAGVFCPQQSTTNPQLAATDFTSWKMVTIRPPAAGETVTRFWDLPTLRSTSELLLATPRVGFFSTPAFQANWPTNASNQMRVTINQTMIVATGAAFDGTDATQPPSTPGLDAAHASAGDCFTCHQLLDPTRSILSSTFSWYYYPATDKSLMAQKGLFAFQGVVKPVATLDDFAATLSAHPLVASAWAQKLCYWVNSAPCSADDPELTRVVSVFQSSSLRWDALVKELVTSPITTHTTETQSTLENGAPIAVARRDHLCAALNARLGLTDVCGLDAATAKKGAVGVVSTIAGGLPSDGYGRGSTIPVLPNQPTLFYRAGLENICEAVATLVVDPPAPTPGARQWSSKSPDQAIADFVSLVMALESADPRSQPAQQLLKSHFTQATQGGAAATDALRSTFVTACLAPSAIGIGL